MTSEQIASAFDAYTESIKRSIKLDKIEETSFNEKTPSTTKRD